MHGPVQCLVLRSSQQTLGFCVTNYHEINNLKQEKANALNEAINQITAVELANSALTAQTAINANHATSSDSATYDSLGRKIVDTYLTAHQTLPDWGPTISAASGNAYNSAVNWVVDQHYLTAVTGDNTPYTQGPNIDITDHVVSGKDWSSEISDASANAVNEAINTITAVASANSATYDSDGNKITETYLSSHQDVSNLPYVQNSALEYSPGGHLVSSISGDAIYAVSAEGAFTAETANYSYVAETANYVADGWEYNESNEITGYSGSAIHSEAGGEGKVYTGVAPIVVDNSQTTGVISAQTARLGVQSPLYFVEDTSASTVIGISGIPEVEGLMYESALGKSDNKITGYNGTAFSAGNIYDVKAYDSNIIRVFTADNTFTVSGKSWQNTIVAASAYAYNQATANASGKYIPYTATGTNEYLTNSALTFSSNYGYINLISDHASYQHEAHIHVHQNSTPSGSLEWYAEIDGADYGHIHQHWFDSTGGETAMAYEKNGLLYIIGGSNLAANWLTADWNNAKNLYTHVNTASASWGNPVIETGSI